MLWYKNLQRVKTTIDGWQSWQSSSCASNESKRFQWLAKEIPYWTDQSDKSLLCSVCACFAHEWNPYMMSQSKLDPISCIVLHEPKKKRLTSLTGHVRYMNILTRLRGFQDKLLNLALFSLYPSLFWELKDKRNFCNFDPKTSEPCYNIDISNVAYSHRYNILRKTPGSKPLTLK